MLPRFVKDPDAIKDYGVDWANWLSAGDSITGHTIIADPGITVLSSNQVGTVVTVILSGGTDGSTYKVTVRITTAASLSDDRSFNIICQAT